ncbi:MULTISPECIES: beta-propeller fold lactonase family protein [unclassified Chelatococcus]|uniref:lactonase family protein n=1 Tax=unclassified Chelatococcus TaxID=2638111 RepID=UPI001BCE9260|nr:MULTISPECIES: beta-propeller fold lactonase family protein [unclassified Chelatococcus]MBS7701600.1 beta-propeller fold lactonase family protein [Chelatococcus sp. YT9]MBX3559715.1 beta-propeller fold lactonase family protein [Chelatococcus sp.]
MIRYLYAAMEADERSPGGIACMALVDDGVPAPMVLASDVLAGFLATHPRLSLLYAASNRADADVRVLRCLPDGTLEAKGVAPIGTNGINYLELDADHALIVMASMRDGCVMTCRVAPNGLLQGPVRRFGQHAGTRFHQARFTPDQRHVVATDIGRDRVTLFACGADGELVERGGVDLPGMGPRHVAFGSAGAVFVAGEKNATVCRLWLDSAVSCLTSDAAVPSLLHAEIGGECLPSEIIALSNGNIVVANRGPDVVTILDGNGAIPRAIADVPCGGAWPRHMYLAGDDLYVANRRSDSVSHLRLSADGHGLEGRAHVSVDNPLCLAMLQV